MTWLVVAVAGAIGASARYAIGTSIGVRFFPWATLGINVSGSFLPTFLVAGPLAERMSTTAGIVITVGFLGAYTAFSTFGYETVALVRDDRWSTAVVYVAASTRSVGDLVALLDRAERGRWSLVVLDADVDTTTASGRLVASVLGSVAEWERRVIGERTKAALAARKAAGKRLGRPVEIPEHVRARIVAEHASGASLAGIARLLDAERVPTARAGRWHASTVRRVLESVQLDALALAAA